MSSTTPPADASGPLDAVNDVVHRLIRRERLVLLVDLGGRALMLAFVVLLLLVLAVLVRGMRSPVAASVVFIGGAGLWVLILAPLVRRWTLSGDGLRQARLIEAIDPALRGRLITAVETSQRGLAPGESASMVALIASRAGALAEQVEPSRVHGGIRQGVVLFAAGLLLFVPLVLSLFVGGPGAVARWWLDGVQVGAAPDVIGGPVAVDAAQVGDLVLYYTYPAYTGLEARLVENSTGDAAGPPGTVVEVRARSAKPIEAAAMVAYDQRFEAQVEQARVMVGTFTIGSEAGSYHLVTYQGEDSQDSTDFLITPEADLAPVVVLDAVSPVLEKAVDEPFELQWRARDDYGVRKVVLRVAGKQNGTLYTAQERRAEVFDTEFMTPGELGLSEGDEVELVVAAWDNDTVGGQKVGVSQPITLVVLGPKGLTDRIEEQRKQIIEAMLTVVADHLVEPFPVARVHGELASWGEAVSKRYAPLQLIVDREWERLPPDSLERSALDQAVSAGGDLVRFASVTFDRGSILEPRPDDLAELGTIRDSAIEALESSILMLDRATRNEALAKAVETTEQLDDLAQDLERALARDDPDPLQLLAMLEHLQAMMKKLAEQSAKLDEGGLKEYLNARQDELGGLMEEIQKAIQEGRMDDARKLMQRLADQVQQLAEGMKDTLERQQGEGSDSMKQAEQLKDELEALEQEQRGLEAQVQELREEEDQAASDEQDKLWQAIRTETEAVLNELSSFQTGLEGGGRAFNEKQRAAGARLDAERLDQSARREDVRGVRPALRNTQFGVDAMHRGWKTAKMLSAEALSGPGRAELNRLMGHLETIQDLLDKLDKQESNPQTSAQSQQLEKQQRQLEQRLESAKEAAKEMMKEFPTQPRGMEEQLEQASKRMEEAGEDLGKGKPMQAQGSQGAAADRIKEARESLEQAMNEAAQQQSGNGGGEGEDSGKGEGDGKGKQKSKREPPRVLLPGAEEFRTPEEYRKALLKGMEGEVPDEFRAMKKRYFEELVRQ